MVNKNNYTLTYSGHGSISSHQEYGTSPSRQHTSMITTLLLIIATFMFSLDSEGLSPACQNVFSTR